MATKNYDKEWEEYFIPGTDVLINNLNIINYDELEEAEKKIVKEKLVYLYLKPLKGKFDTQHLLNIHKFIFEDIYPFAGKIRKCSLQKDFHIFCYPEDIETQLKNILEEMNNYFDNNDIYSIDIFAYKLAEFYYELQYIHPFREGNGRSIRVFIRDFIVEKSKNKSCGSLDIDYTKINKERLVLGTSNKYLYPNYITLEFMKALVPNQNKNTQSIKSST